MEVTLFEKNTVKPVNYLVLNNTAMLVKRDYLQKSEAVKSK